MTTPAGFDIAGQFLVPQGPAAAGAAQRFESLMNATAPGQGAATGPGQSPTGAERHERVGAIGQGADRYIDAVPRVLQASDKGVSLPKVITTMGKELGEQMRASVERSRVAADTVADPDLAAAHKAIAEIKEFGMLTLQFNYVGKMVELTEKDLQTLYKQQG